MKEKEYCENCKKEITDEMKNNQQVIYASAEHTLYAPSEDQLLPLGDTDEMFSGVFCCQECYNEISGINIAYKKGISLGEQSERERIIEIIKGFDLNLIFTDLIDKETKRIIELPKEIQILMDEYWKYIQEELLKEINCPNDSEEGNVLPQNDKQTQTGSDSRKGSEVKK